MERLILPSLASLSVLAGLGVSFLCRQVHGKKMAPVAPAVAALAIGECALGIVQCYPYTLSYYSPVVGGPPGARRLGLESTYYWETLGPEFYSWLRHREMHEPVELCFPFGLLNIMLLREWGVFPENVKVVHLEPTTHPDYVLQRTPAHSLLMIGGWNTTGIPCLPSAARGSICFAFILSKS